MFYITIILLKYFVNEYFESKRNSLPQNTEHIKIFFEFINNHKNSALKHWSQYNVSGLSGENVVSKLLGHFDSP